MYLNGEYFKAKVYTTWVYEPLGLASHRLFSGSLYEPYYFGVLGPGFLNQVPTLL